MWLGKKTSVLKTSSIIFHMYCTLIRKTCIGSWVDTRGLLGENIILEICLNKIYKKEKTIKDILDYKKCIAIKCNFRFLFVLPFWRKFILLMQNMDFFNNLIWQIYQLVIYSRCSFKMDIFSKYFNIITGRHTGRSTYTHTKYTIF